MINYNNNIKSKVKKILNKIDTPYKYILKSKELINYLMKDYDQDPNNIWKSELFGRSLDSIVKEGIQAKLSLMPDNIRFKLQQTLTKLVNKGSSSSFIVK
jgi:hypothetical protein